MEEQDLLRIVRALERRVSALEKAQDAEAFRASMLHRLRLLREMQEDAQRKVSGKSHTAETTKDFVRFYALCEVLDLVASACDCPREFWWTPHRPACLRPTYLDNQGDRQ